MEWRAKQTETLNTPSHADKLGSNERNPRHSYNIVAELYLA